MNRRILVLAALTVVLTGCGGNGEEDGTSVEVIEEIQVVSLPGIATAPEGDTVGIPPDKRVLLYYWLPINKHPAMEEDLLYLASIDSSTLVLPLQLDADSRNHAQRIVNGLEVSMAVYLADSVLGSTLQLGVLPVTALYLPDGTVQVEEGFGAPLRLLGTDVIREAIPEEILVDSTSIDSLSVVLPSDSVMADTTELEIPSDSLTEE